jgi:hypothetical protein
MTHITRLQAENIKKLTVIDIRPGTSAGVVPIRGRNAQGKSSTLDAIMMALGGAKFTPSQPIRTGEDEGAIRLELDDGQVVLRRFTRGGNDTIEVTNGEGFKAGSPQAVLNKLYASVAFDPLAFTRLKPAEQLATLRGLVKLDVDVDALEKGIATDYEARRDTGRELERESTRLEQMPTFEGAGQKVDEAALEQTIAGAVEANALVERRKASRERFAEALETNRGSLRAAQADLAEIQRSIDDLERVIAEQEQTLAGAEPLPNPVDVTQAQADLRDARETNRRVEANTLAASQKQLVDVLSERRDEQTTRIEERRQQIAAAIARAEMPVPGLGFGEGEVLFNDVPLDQASSAEQLRVSTAIGIASAPKLRVMLVRDGSLLDDEGQTILAEMAAKHDFQLWVEAVDQSGKVGIVLEDGAVASIDGEPAPEPEPIAAKKRRAKKEATVEGAVSGSADAGADGNLPESAGGDADDDRSSGAGDTGGDGAAVPADEQPPFEPDPKPARAKPATPSLFE